MRWEQTEFILKGIYLGLLVVVGLFGPSWLDLAHVVLWTVGGLVLCLAVAGFQKVREGYRIRGRLLGFLLFLILENPGMVYAGILVGLGVGTSATFKDRVGEDDWFYLAPVGGGAMLGLVLYSLRHIRARRQRLWLSLALAVALVGGAIAFLLLKPDSLAGPQKTMIGVLLLAGLPGFYLLTFASLVEETEVEIAAICAALGVGLWILGELISPTFNTIALVLPVALYFVYTRRILPGLRVFKHALRGLSYAKIGRHRQALYSLGRALQLDPQHSLAREQLWSIHRELNIDQLRNEPETLALLNYDLCLERVSWLLLLDKPRPEQIQEAQKLLDLVGTHRPGLEPCCAYWRAVAFLHQKNPEEAAKNLESILAEGAADTPQRRLVHLDAWQLALIWHPEMIRRVGTPLLGQPGRRMDAIAAVERRLAQKADDQPAWDLKRLLYSELSEAEYNFAAGPDAPAQDFDHAYVLQLGLALIDNPQQWQRGCEYLRLAARGSPLQAPLLFVQMAKVHEKFGDHDGMWRNYHRAIQLGRTVGPKNLAEEDRHNLFAAVKWVGDTAKANGDIDTALEAIKFYSSYERSGLETYRTLADLFERKKDVWMALHCTEHGLSYDAADKDLLERKDRYYYSIEPADLKQRVEQVYKWFDVDYCMTKARTAVEKYDGNLDVLDWGGHLAELAHIVKPESITANVIRARVRRLKGEIPEALAILEHIRKNKPEKFASNEEEESWYLAHRLLADMYLEEKPDQAVECLQEYRKCNRSGADTLYKLGRAYENLGDHPRAARFYEQVTAYENHPLYYEAQEGLSRVRRSNDPVA